MQHVENTYSASLRDCNSLDYIAGALWMPVNGRSTHCFTIFCQVFIATFETFRLPKIRFQFSKDAKGKYREPLLHDKRPPPFYSCLLGSAFRGESRRGVRVSHCEVQHPRNQRYVTFPVPSAPASLSECSFIVVKQLIFIPFLSLEVLSIFFVLRKKEGRKGRREHGEKKGIW